MNYSKRDVVIGFVIILLFVAGAFYYKKVNSPKKLSTPPPAQFEYLKDLDTQDDYFSYFKNNIPTDANSVELNDVSGGDARGIATENEILVDAPDPDTDFYYQAWLEKDGDLVSLGKLKIAKGGWFLEYKIGRQKAGTKILVSLEKAYDNKIESKILEGSFK